MIEKRPIPRRFEIEPLPKCSALKVNGESCSKAVEGFESLKRNGLLDHPDAGTKCHWHLVGSTKMVEHGLETRRARKREREAAEAEIIVLSDVSPIEPSPEPLQVPNLYTVRFPAAAFSPLLSVDQRKRLIAKSLRPGK